MSVDRRGKRRRRLFAPRAQLLRKTRGLASELNRFFFKRFEFFAAVAEPFKLLARGSRVFYNGRRVAKRERAFNLPQRAKFFFDFSRASSDSSGA